MKLLHYELQISMLWLNYCSLVQGKLDLRARKPVPRIWNGKPAEIGQFPYQVGLARIIRPHRDGIYLVFCGGALIGKSKVLSAAHCLVLDDSRTRFDKLCCQTKIETSQEDIDSVRIIAGTIDSFVIYKGKPSDEYQWRNISSYIYPKKYEFPEKDICVIFTNQPYDFNDKVSSLPYASKYIDYGAIKCTASGFGILNKDMNMPEFTPELMWEEFKLLTAKDCKSTHSTDMTDFICTESHDKDVTQGDSGSALVCKNTGDPRESDKGIIVGIVCGETEEGNFFTRISSYTGFVDSAEHNIACLQFFIFLGCLYTILS